MIQKPRPMVESTRSPSWTLMSVMGVRGRSYWNFSHVVPSSMETYMPNSVPAKSRPSRSVSSRMTRVAWWDGIPLWPGVRNVQLWPKSSVL